MHQPIHHVTPPPTNRLRHALRLVLLLTLGLLLGLAVGGSAARAQTFPHLVLGEDPGIAEISWSDLTATDPDIASPSLSFRLESPPSFGQLADMEEGKVYIPGPEFWSAGGDSFSYSFEGSSAPAVLVTITSPRLDLFADDMESGDASAWWSASAAVAFPEHPVHGRRLQVSASPDADRFLSLGISAVPYETEPFLGGPNQNTGTNMVVDLGDPGDDQLPGMEGELVLWERVDGPHSTRLRLRARSGLPEVRAENGLEGEQVVTPWLPLTLGTPQDVSIRHVAKRMDESLALDVGAHTTSVADDSAFNTSSAGMHRLGTLDVDGLDGLTLSIDAFRIGSLPIANDRLVIADDFESIEEWGPSLAPEWILQGGAYTVLGPADTLSGTVELGIGLEDAAVSGESGAGLAYFFDQRRLSATVHLRLDASTVDLAPGSSIQVVDGVGAVPSERRFQLQLRRDFSGHELRVVAWDDSGTEHASTWSPLSGEDHAVAVRWQARAFSSALSLWIDGDQVATVRGFLDGRDGIGAVRIGAFGLHAGSFAPERQGGPGDRLSLDSVAIWR